MSTLRTAEKDANFYSLNRDSAVWYAGTPGEQLASHPPADGMRLLPGDPKLWDSVLKCSNRRDTALSGLVVAQGKENALDINNFSSALWLRGDWGVEGREGEQVLTIKGGSSDIVIDGVVHSRGLRADIAAGLWSDQSTAPSHHIDVSGLSHVTGRALTVILCRVDRATVKLPPGAKVLFWKSLGATIGWWAKWVAVKVGIIR